MKLISNRYLLSILSILIISSAQASFAQESPPSFVKIGETYRTVIGIIELTFTVQKIEGRWIKVRVDEGIPAKTVTGDVWLNLNNLTILLEGKKPARDKVERRNPKVETPE